MAWEYILLISAAGVFLALLAACIVLTTRDKALKLQNDEELYASYSDNKIKKLDYDVSFQDEDTYRLLSEQTERQLTFEDVLSENELKLNEKLTQKLDESLFVKVNCCNIEKIYGNYKL